MCAPGAGIAQTYKKQTIMAASANTPGSNHGVLLNRFKQLVESESNGAITVKVYLGGTMGDEAANVKQLQTKIGELGVKVYTEPLDSPGGKKTRVRAGPFANRDAADKTLDKLKRIGVNGVVAAR